MITIDFETRSKAPLVGQKGVGAWRYAEDPSTEIHCMAWKMGDDVDIWIPGQTEFPIELIESDEPVEAHNALFEIAIWYNILHKRMGYPMIPLERWHCSLAKCAASALPLALGEAGKALDLPMQKNEEGRKVMQKLARPRKPTKNNSSEWHGSPDEFQILYDYCIDDVLSEECLSHMTRNLSDQERALWLLDQKINLRGIKMDTEAIDAALDIVEQYKEKKTKELQDLTNGEVQTGNQRDVFLRWFHKQGIDMPDLTKGTVSQYLKKDLPDDVRKALELRQVLTKTSIAKYNKIKQCLSKGGRIRGAFQYHGASTGRWAARLIQPHNLPANFKKPKKMPFSEYARSIDMYFDILKTRDLETFEMFYPDVMSTISRGVRGLIIPSEGRTMYGGDYASIEARVLFWLAGETQGLEAFRKGKDLYVEMARDIYGIYNREVTPDERALGKQVILGCGYQMWIHTFIDTCAKYAMDVDEELAKKAILMYREKFSRVVDLWEEYENAAIQAVKTGLKIKARKTTWACLGKFLYCKLPSGSCIAYFDPKIETREHAGRMKDTLTYMTMATTSTQGRKWQRVSTYGGKLTENVDQRISRDLLSHSMHALDNAGYGIFLHVHDEIVGEHDNGSIEEFERLMSSRPDWAQEIPVEVEGWKGKRYLK